MNQQIESLKQLQKLDGELFQLRKQLQQKPQELEAAKAKLSTQEAAVKSADDRLKTLQLAQKQKELDLQTREANVKKLQSQLFQLKTNKEYTTMQHEINALKADNSLLEEEILRFFDDIDKANTARQQEQARLAEQQKIFQAEQAKIDQETGQIRERIDQLERDRKSLVPGVPGESLAVYERVLNIRNGLVLVPIVHESCGGCHRRLPPQVLNQVKLNAQLIMCENCNRILYIDDLAAV